MGDDFLIELGHLGFTARLKRLSDSLSENIKELYRRNNIDIEPSWHLVLLYLSKRESVTMTELASVLRLSKPATTKMVRQMQKKGYLNIQDNARDGRKKNISLTNRAISNLPEFEKIWQAGQASIRDVIGDDVSILDNLATLEGKFAEQSFVDRAMRHLGQD